MAKHGIRVEKVCPNCKKAFYILPYLERRGKTFCSILCRNRALTRFGYKSSTDTCQKISFSLRKRYRDRWGTRKCPTCGKEFQDYKKSKQIYCSRECAYISPAFGRKISQASVGRKLSEEARKNIGLATKKKWQNEEFKMRVGKAISLGRVGIRVSDEGRESIRRAALLNTPKRTDHWNWQGGITPVRESIRKTFEYKQWVQAVFERDNFTCQHCKRRGGDLEADHYPKAFAQLLDTYNIENIQDARSCKELWSLDNGRTLCMECHLKTYKGIPKKPWLKL